MRTGAGSERSSATNPGRISFTMGYIACSSSVASSWPCCLRARTASILSRVLRDDFGTENAWRVTRIRGQAGIEGQGLGMPEGARLILVEQGRFAHEVDKLPRVRALPAQPLVEPPAFSAGPFFTRCCHSGVRYPSICAVASANASVKIAAVCSRTLPGERAQGRCRARHVPNPHPQ